MLYVLNHDFSFFAYWNIQKEKMKIVILSILNVLGQSNNAKFMLLQNLVIFRPAKK